MLKFSDIAKRNDEAFCIINGARTLDFTKDRDVGVHTANTMLILWLLGDVLHESPDRGVDVAENLMAVCAITHSVECPSLWTVWLPEACGVDGLRPDGSWGTIAPGCYAHRFVSRQEAEEALQAACRRNNYATAAHFLCRIWDWLDLRGW